MTGCRFCGAGLEHVFADLGMSPLANANVRAGLASPEPFFPLRVLVCERCLLVQLEDFASRERLFDQGYPYFSSYSASWLEHSRRFADDITERLGLDESSHVLELASNDGYLLQFFRERGISVLGIEPTANTANAARGKGIDTRIEFWGRETAREVAAGGLADLIVGNNVLGHVPDPGDFVEGMKIALASAGTVTLEFPHLLELIERRQWDTIYHEHFSYLSFSSARRIFESRGLRLFDVERLPTHGGSLRVFGCHADDPRGDTGPARELVELERTAGLEDVRSYLDFGERVAEDKRAILSLLIALKEEGNSIAGYGAPAKGNTLLNFCGIGRDILDFTCDVSPHKQGHVLPGTRIPILAPDAIRERRPDVVLILPWNLREEIMEQLAYVREWGGRFAARDPDLRLFA